MRFGCYCSGTADERMYGSWLNQTLIDDTRALHFRMSNTPIVNDEVVAKRGDVAYWLSKHFRIECLWLRRVWSRNDWLSWRLTDEWWLSKTVWERRLRILLADMVQNWFMASSLTKLASRLKVLFIITCPILLYGTHSSLQYICAMCVVFAPEPRIPTILWCTQACHLQLCVGWTVAKFCLRIEQVYLWTWRLRNVRLPNLKKRPGLTSYIGLYLKQELRLL